MGNAQADAREVVPVIQADRDAALELVSPWEARNIADPAHPAHNGDQLVQAFARHRIEQVAQALAQREGWRPIETAPKDGETCFLAYWPSALLGSGTVTTAIWSETRKEFSPWPSPMRGVQFTHWQPLPAPPLTAAPTPQHDKEMSR